MPPFVTRDVLAIVVDGRVRPIASSAAAQRAADRMRSNEAVGKIVLEMPSAVDAS